MGLVTKPDTPSDRVHIDIPVCEVTSWQWPLVTFRWKGGADNA